MRQALVSVHAARDQTGPVMFEILTVCTGNICRSPLAELLLRGRLADLEGHIHSAGTYGLDQVPMTTEAQRLATLNGVPAETAAAHRSQPLDEALLSSPDLILVMTREHRRQVLELAPSRMRAVFTLREFARLAEAVTDDDLRAAAASAGTDPAKRLRAVAGTIAAHRGIVGAPSNPQDDDVIDPYRRSWNTYQLTAEQLVPTIDQVVRAVRIVHHSVG